MINLVIESTMKVDLSLKNVYGENMELSKYFDVFLAQAKVACKAGVNYGSKAIIIHYQGELQEKDGSITKAPVWRNPLVKLDLNLEKEELWEIIKFDTFCRQWYNQCRANIHEEQLAHLLWRKPS